MKKILGLLAVFLMISANCFAMTFSQPVLIGRVWGTPMGGDVIENATENKGELYRMRNGEIIPERTYRNKVYGKGIARFGENNTAIYFHYNWDCWKQGREFYENNGAKFGGKDPSNTVALLIEEGWGCDINKIPNDKGKILYLLSHSGAVRGYETYIIFNVSSDGEFIKMIDTRSVVKNYLGANKMGMRGVSLDKLYCNGDTIIVPYTNHNKETRRIFKAGEFRFKWDEATQWFGVEHVVY